MMIPSHVTLIPMYILMINTLNIRGYVYILIIPFVCTVNNVFLMKQFMSTLPSTLIEAGESMLAPSSEYTAKIILPLAKPG